MLPRGNPAADTTPGERQNTRNRTVSHSVAQSLPGRALQQVFLPALCAQLATTPAALLNLQPKPEPTQHGSHPSPRSRGKEIPWHIRRRGAALLSIPAARLRSHTAAPDGSELLSESCGRAVSSLLLSAVRCLEGGCPVRDGSSLQLSSLNLKSVC